MPGVLSKNFLSPKQEPKQITGQFIGATVSPVSVVFPMVACTPNINDTSQSKISEEVWLRIKSDNELRSCAKSLRTAISDSISLLEVVWCS